MGVDPISIRARRRKTYLLDLVDGKCPFCSYRRYDGNLSFHHVVEDKSFELTIKAFQRRSAFLLPEIRKCVVTCHNCHGEIHAGLVSKEQVMAAFERFRHLLKEGEEGFLALDKYV